MIEALKKFTFLLILVTTWLITCQRSWLHAQESMPVTTQELTARSGKIVIGKVVDQYSAWDEFGREIYTYITLNVEKNIKSDHPDSMIIIRQLGGKVGDVESQVMGLPQFEKGERVLVFLGPFRGTRYYGLIDWHAGKYRIEKAGNRQETLRGAGPAHGQTLEKFVKQLRSYL